MKIEYFDWLCSLVCENGNNQDIFSKLLWHLHKRTFVWILSRDKNRAEDGKQMRFRFRWRNNIPEREAEVLCSDKPCSVLEMMVALAVRCEENIMDDPRYGNRTGQWFWEMIASLGLNGQYDALYDEHIVDDILDRFMFRKYQPNGKGGLFTIRHHREDLRYVEIWQQLNWYLTEFMGY